MPNSELSGEEQELLRRVPPSGSIGNVRLREQLGWDTERYFRARDSLVEKGELAIGRGRGGSIKRTSQDTATVEAVTDTGLVPRNERKLYAPIAAVLERDWARSVGFENPIVQETASQGRRETGGRWTRPDITVIAIRTYNYVPGRFIDVVTFEVKPEDGWDVTAVFEAAAHSRFATESYLLIHAPRGEDGIDKDELERLEKEAARFDIGLCIFQDPANYQTYKFLVEAGRRQPHPDEIEEFIGTQLTELNKQKLLRWLRT